MQNSSLLPHLTAVAESEQETTCPIKPIILTERTANRWGRNIIYRRLMCPVCTNVSFTQYKHFAYHLQIKHECHCCLSYVDDIGLHVCSTIQSGSGSSHQPQLNLHQFSLIESVFRGIILTYKCKFDDVVLESISDTFEYTYDELQSILTYALHLHKNIRVSVSLDVTLEHVIKKTTKDVSLFTPFNRVFNPNYILETMRACADYIGTSLELYCDGESGYSLVSINSLEVKIGKYKTGIAKGYIPLPKQLSARHFLNIKSPDPDDALCFVRCIIAGLCRTRISLPDHPNKQWDELNKNERRRLKRLWQNSSSYEHLIQEFSVTNEINFSDCYNGVDLDTISIFLDNNPSISLTIFGNDGKSLYPIRPATEIKSLHCDLLLLKQPILPHDQAMPTSFLDVQYRYHYCLIMTLPISYESAGGHHRKEVCQFCFGTYANLSRHQEVCMQRDGVRKVTFPKEDSFSFKHFKSYEDIPFKIYFKFHYCQPPENDTSKIYPADLLYTSIHGNLEVCGYSLCVIGPVNKIKNQLFRTHSYFGNNAIELFLKQIFELAEEIRVLVVNQLKRPMIMTQLQQVQHKLSTHCRVCTVEFSEASPKVADHDHITGEFRDSLCQKCNSLIRIKCTPVVVGHGVAKKELHNILTSLKGEWVSKAKIIMKTGNEILLLEIMGVRFVDFQFFLDAPIEQIITRHMGANTIDTWPTRCPLLYECYKGRQEHVHKLIPSLAYPSAFYTGPSSLEYNEFPLEDYFVDLIGLQDTEGKLFKSKQAFNLFDCKNFRDYATLYGTSQVVLLADVVTNFLKFTMEKFELCFLHYVTLSSYAWDICTRKIFNGFQFIKDKEMIEFLSHVGGPCGSVCRLLEAKNERLHTFTTDKERSHILVVDENAMYGNIIRNSKICHSEFEWVDDLSTIDIDNYDENSDIGYIVSSDLDYRRDVALRTLNLPLLPYHRSVNLSQLTAKEKKAWAEMHGKGNSRIESRIMLDVHNKTDYKCEIATLKYYKSRGIIIRKLNKAIKYKQTNWLGEFYELVALLRKEAKSSGDDIGYMFLKHIHNRIFGYLMLSSEKYVDVHIACTSDEAIKYMSKHNFISYKILNKDEGIVMFSMRKNTIHYNKNPAAASFVLDRAKRSLYSFLEILESKLGPGLKIGFYDTDALACQVPDPENNFYERLKTIPNLDYSELNPFHILYENSHAGEGGYWKVQTLEAVEIVSLRGKCYSIKEFCEVCNSAGDPNCVCSAKKTCSGFPDAKNRLTHKMYKDSLFKYQPHHVDVNLLQAQDHKLKIVKKRFTAFGSINSSRIILEDGINTLPYGAGWMRQISDLIPIHNE